MVPETKVNRSKMVSRGSTTSDHFNGGTASFNLASNFVSKARKLDSSSAKRCELPSRICEGVIREKVGRGREGLELRARRGLDSVVDAGVLEGGDGGAAESAGV